MSRTSRSALPAYAVWLAGAGIAVIAGGGGFFAYWTGMIGDRPVRIASEIEARLAAEGFNAVDVSLDRKWAATLSGEVTGQDSHRAALDLVRSEKAVKSVTDTLVVKPSVDEIRTAAKAALDEARVQNGAAEVDPNGVVVVSGLVDSLEQRDALADSLRTIAGVTAVDDQTARSMTWVARAINDALSLAGLTRVRAQARDATSIILTGEVEAASDFARAEAIARKEGALTLSNQVRIAPPAPAAAYQQPAQAAAIAADPNQLPASYVGQWGAFGLASGPLRYAVMMTIQPGAVGSDVGQAIYGTTNAAGTNFTVSCTARMTLKSVEPGAITVEETLIQRSLICPGNKIVRLQTISGGLQGEWRRKKDNSVAMTGPLTPGRWQTR